jgi:hypothetical protein
MPGEGQARQPRNVTLTPARIVHLPATSVIHGWSITSNPYGKHPVERAKIMQDLAEVEPLLRATATIEIDATAPLSQVVRHLENLS